MSNLRPEPGEIWATKERHSGGNPNRPMRAVKVINVHEVPREGGIGTVYVHYEYVNGPSIRRRGDHKYETFVQRYVRTKEADDAE